MAAGVAQNMQPPSNQSVKKGDVKSDAKDLVKLAEAALEAAVASGEDEETLKRLKATVESRQRAITEERPC